MRLPVTLHLPKLLASPWRPAGRRVARLTLRTDGLLDIGRADGTTATCTVDGQTTVFPWLVVLRWRGERATESLVLPRLAMPATEHRLLRLWLRWQASAG